MKKLRCAVIGCGKMGQIRIGEILKNDYCELVYVHDAFVQPPEALQAYSVSEVEKCLDSRFVDAVFIAAMPSSNIEYLNEALLGGLHVFCEKPPAANLQALKSVRNLVSSSNFIVKFGFNHRVHKSVLKLHEIVQAGALGKLLHISGQYGKAGSIDFEKNWRNYEKYSGGGILIDQGIHLIDLVMMMLNDELICKAALVDNLHWNISCEDNVFALLRGARTNVPVNIHSSAVLWKHNFRLEVFGTRGYAVLQGILSSTGSYAPETLTYSLDGPQNDKLAMGKPSETRLTFDQDDSWQIELEDFLSCIQKQEQPVNGSYSDALCVMKTIDAIYQK